MLWALLTHLVGFVVDLSWPVTLSEAVSWHSCVWTVRIARRIE